MIALFAAATAAPFHPLKPGNSQYSWGWDAIASAQRLYIRQPVDHFDAENNNTWLQAFYINDEHWAGATSNAPIFLYVGGEGAISNHSVTANFVVDVLPDFKGLMLGLEHRYYGCWNMSSCPMDPTAAAPDMRYLSSHQALQDLAAFHDFVVKRYGMQSAAPWVLIGGSYPGMLAAFARAMFPERFAMAVASSAPVRAKFDMNEYYDTNSLAYKIDVEGVRGSPECYQNIRDGHAAVGKMLGSAKGRAALAALFDGTGINASRLADPAYQLSFAGRGVAYFPAQGNAPTCTRPACGISQICAIMTNSSCAAAPVECLARVRRAQRHRHADALVEEPHHAAAVATTGAAPSPPHHYTTDYWWYQTCTEFAFYQTCEVGSQCFFTQGLDVEHPLVSPSGKYQNDFCQAQYNISTEATRLFVRRSNEFYAPLIRRATKIIWPNGDVDPWHGLSHLTSPGREQPAIWPVRGAHHCAWMSSARAHDQRSVQEARRDIFGIVKKWLADAGVP